MTDEREDRESDASFVERIAREYDDMESDPNVEEMQRLFVLARRGAAQHPQDDTILIDGTPFSRRWLAEQVGPWACTQGQPCPDPKRCPHPVVCGHTVKETSSSAAIAAYLRHHVSIADTKLDSAEADRLAAGIVGLGGEATEAARDVLAERARQVEDKGWTSKHDDKYTRYQLARAACCYAFSTAYDGVLLADYWPWDLRWWKIGSPRRNLVKSGALILAEIERLDRAAAREMK